MSSNKLWDRRKGETSHQFVAFTHYRDMAPPRSAKAIAAACKKSASLINTWSAKNKWRIRAAAWDTEVDRREQIATLSEVEAMRKRQVKLGLLLQDIASTQYAKLAKKLKRLKWDPELNLADLRNMAKFGADLERLNRGEPSEIVQQVESGVDFSKFTPAELRQLKAMRAKHTQTQVDEEESEES